MEQTGRLRTRIVGGLLLVGSLLYLALPLLAIAWFRSPTPGLFFDPNLVVNDGSDPSWPAAQATPPVAYPERLVAIDGTPVQDAGAVGDIFSGKAVGDEVALTFVQPPPESFIAASRPGAERTVTLPLIRLETTAQLIYFWWPFLAGLLALGIGLWTFRARPEVEAAQVFALLTLAAAWSVGGIFDATTTHTFLPVWVTGLSFAGALHALLAGVFPHEIRFARHWPWVRWLVLLPAGGVCVWAQWWLFNSDDPWAYAIPWRAAYFLNGSAILLALAVMTYRSVRSTSPLVRQQGRLILLAALIALGPVAVWFVTFAFPVRYVLLPVTIYPLAIGYTIVRYRLLDINVVLRRGLTYSLLSAGYVGVVLLLSLTLGPALAADDPVILIVFVLVLTLSFNAVRTQLQQAVDRAFLRQPVQYDGLLRHYNRALTTAVDVDQVASALLHDAREGVPGATFRLYLPNETFAGYAPYGGDGDGAIVEAESPLVRVISQDPGALYLAEERTWPAELRHHRDAVQALDAAVVVPMLSSGELLGWLALSEKENGQQFVEEELSYLNALADQSLIALERVNIIRRLEARVEELNMLSQFSQALNFTIDFDDLLELVYTNCERLLQVQDFCIVLKDPDTEEAYTAFCVAGDERLPEREGRHRPVEDGRAPDVIATGQPLVAQTEAGHTWMGAPLNAGADTLGVLYTRSPHPGRGFSQRQQQLFGVLADRTATVLDRWQADRKLQIHAQQLETINEVTRSLTATLDLDALLELIVEKAIELLDTVAGSLLILDENTNQLEFRVVHGPVSRDLVGQRLPLGTGLAGTAAQTGRPLLVNDVHHDERWFQDIDTSTDFVTRASLSVPLLRDRQVVGVLQVVNKQNDAPFAEEDQTLLTGFAGQAVVALETARLLRQTDEALQARVNELSLLQQLDRDLSATLDLDQVVALTLNWALRICDAPAGSIVLVNDEGLPRIHATRGYDPSFNPDAITAETIRGALVGAVLETGEPSVTGNVHAEPNYVAAAFATRAQMTIPILHKQAVIGAVVIESDEYDAFTEEDVETAARVATRAGAAIANALLYRQVIAANEAKSEFVSMVSHELKTPLTSMKGYTELMLSGMAGDLTEEQQKFLHTIANNIGKTRRLIQDLTDISRIETGKLNVSPEPISFATVVSEAMQTIQGAYEEENALHLDLPADLPMVLGDEQRLVQVLTNLLSNACKYSPAGADVTVRVWPEVAEGEDGTGPRPVVHCAVEDNGYGIAKADQERLFTKFFRADTPDVRQSPGTGLGLSITKGIVELHGGRIWFESEPSAGTTFHFTIPQVT